MAVSTGAEGVVLGGEASYDTSKAALTKWVLGLGYTASDYQAALLLNDQNKGGGGVGGGGVGQGRVLGRGDRGSACVRWFKLAATRRSQLPTISRLAPTSRLPASYRLYLLVPRSHRAAVAQGHRRHHHWRRGDPRPQHQRHHLQHRCACCVCACACCVCMRGGLAGWLAGGLDGRLWECALMQPERCCLIV